MVQARVLVLVSMLAAWASALAGCVPYKQFNVTPEEYLTEIVPASDSSVGADIAVIEFDEFGMFWDIAQYEAALERVAQRNAESERGIAVFMYVHGWQNNADPDDEENDLYRFREGLRTLAARMGTGDRANAPDRIVGVYMGWRGLTSNAPFLSTTTFWDRRRAGERVAGYNMREAFVQITKKAKERSDTKVLITGHSMGGMIVGLSLGPAFETLLLANAERGFRSLADGVHLLNPALDAMATMQLVEFMKRYNVVAELHHTDGRIEPAPGPVLVSITSEADSVTKDAYHIGQWLDRTAIDKRKFKDETWPSQTELATRATGHLPFLASHRAFVRDGEVVIEPIEGAWNTTPYWIISTTGEIGKDHGDIRNSLFEDLRRQLLELNRIYDTDVQTWLRTSR